MHSAVRATPPVRPGGATAAAAGCRDFCELVLPHLIMLVACNLCQDFYDEMRFNSNKGTWLGKIFVQKDGKLRLTRRFVLFRLPQ